MFSEKHYKHVQNGTFVSNEILERVILYLLRNPKYHGCRLTPDSDLDVNQTTGMYYVSYLTKHGGDGNNVLPRPCGYMSAKNFLKEVMSEQP